MEGLGKSSWGGHINYHAASSWVIFNFDIPVEGGIMLKDKYIPRWCFSCMFHVFFLFCCCCFMAMFSL